MNKTWRPIPPKRAVITAGMPYGSKSLHFGHIGAVFVHADTFYRFLQDRIGKENVIFVSGTDCYGSPIIASYKNYCEKEESPLSLEEFVLSYYEEHKRVLKAYEVEPSFYAASAFGKGGKEHEALSVKWFNELLEKSRNMEKPILKKMSTLQFYDKKEEVYLNGRQVLGSCPVDGCSSNQAYADECSMGHQYQPMELIDPVSTLTGERPELVKVENWYFDLPAYMPKLKDMIEKLKSEKKIRPNVYSAIDEFLKPPVTYVKREDHERLIEYGISDLYDGIIDDGKKPSITYEYNDLDSRDRARKILDQNNIRYRTGKTLVPFRLSGNVDWGIPVPHADGLSDLTFWVWPESLWAPLSFTKSHLKNAPEKLSDWRKWWFDPDSSQFQFIGEDNIYFYGIAEMGMLMFHLGLFPDDPNTLDASYYPQIISNCHILFMNRKASSSDDIKPPMAIDLLDHYTSDDLRMHFLSLGLSKRSVSFNPKAFEGDNANLNEQDPVLKDGNVLTNVFNRILRSCFYTAQQYTDCKIPKLEPTEEIKQIVQKRVLEYERNMLRQEFHLVIYAVDDLIRKVSKHWAKHSKNTDDYSQVLSDCFYAARIITVLLHPITPGSAENIRIKMGLDESIWEWERIFETIDAFTNTHQITKIPPKYDFYEKKIFAD